MNCPHCGMPPKAMSKCIRPTWECGSQEGYQTLPCRKIAAQKARADKAEERVRGLRSVLTEWLDLAIILQDPMQRSLFHPIENETKMILKRTQEVQNG